MYYENDFEIMISEKSDIILFFEKDEVGCTSGKWQDFVLLTSEGQSYNGTTCRCGSGCMDHDVVHAGTKAYLSAEQIRWVINDFTNPSRSSEERKTLLENIRRWAEENGYCSE